ncbi:MAG: GTP pyrophosphokinase [Erysipelotrichaceae bacterium]|nr:GTP pyrophosphokinase [Erysipelotrichaceae bacterium]
MIYTKLTRLAINTAYNAHHGSYDKFEIPYIFHPYHLAEQMDDEYSTCVALLHDVVEDTDYTIEDLEKLFPKEIIDALLLLTHDNEVPYLKYIENIKSNKLATKVKLADLKHNSDTTRLEKIEDKELYRLEKYKKAQEILTK